MQTPAKLLSACLATLPLTFGACTQKPKPESDEGKAAPAAADASDTPSAPTGSAAATGASGATGATGDAAPAKQCARYCFEGTPCGDECLPEGQACEQAEATAGGACSSDERPEPKFRKGDRALAGLIAPDVFAFNKAQGDPVDGPFTLEMAFEGAPELADASKGKLFANLETTMGTIRCELFEDKTPLTVANFVGLGRGTRPWYDSRSKQWKTEVYYADILIHRVIDNFMVQMGDHTGGGSGGPGYFVPDEFDKTLSHNQPGILSMANRNRVDQRTQKLIPDETTGLPLGNTGSSQFFVTIAPGKRADYLDGRHTIFGKCDPEVALKIGKVPTRAADRPVEDVKFTKVTFERAEK